MSIVLMSSGFIPSTLGAVRQHWQVIDIECQREALAYLWSSRRWPSASVGLWTSATTLTPGRRWLPCRRRLRACRC